MQLVKGSIWADGLRTNVQGSGSSVHSSVERVASVPNHLYPPLLIRIGPLTPTLFE